MSKKILMIVLILFFFLGLIWVLLTNEKKMPGTAVNQPLPSTAPILPVITVVPTPTGPPQLSNMENDLSQMENDLSKMKTADNRLEPPTFLFDLGLKQTQ